MESAPSVPRHRVGGLAALALALAVACGGSARKEPGPAVAEFAERRIPAARFEAYLDRVLGDEDVSVDGEDLDRVKSRLLDAFIEEEILLHEAIRRDMRVDEREIEAYLAPTPGVDPPDRDDPAWAVARRNLTIQKLRAAMVADHVEVSEQEVDAYLERHGGDFEQGPSVIVRPLRLDGVSEAKRIRIEIIRRRMSFADAAKVFGEKPEHSRAVELGLDALPDPVREAVKNLEPGKVSRPVELPGGVYLFLVEGWSEKDPRDRARQELVRARSREITRELVRRLKDELRLEVHLDHLPFRYVPEGEA